MKASWPIVEVEWVDSMGYSEWCNPDSLKRIMQEEQCMAQSSAGYQIEKTDGYIAIANSSHVEDTLVTHVIQIPMCAITKLTYLRK